MLLVNHGGLTVGPTVGDAFMRFYDLQRACEIQLAIQASGQATIQYHNLLSIIFIIKRMSCIAAAPVAISLASHLRKAIVSILVLLGKE